MVGGCLLARAALNEIAAAGQDADKAVALAAYFAEDTLSRAPAAVAGITQASQALQDLGAQLWT